MVRGHGETWIVNGRSKGAGILPAKVKGETLIVVGLSDLIARVM